MTAFPEHLRYTAEHEWLEEGDPATFGITQTAADALGELVYVELPSVGDEVSAGAVCGEVESTKSVSELFSPVSGTVAEVNEAAVEDPAIVSSDPYGTGWLLRVSVTGTGPLLTADEYRSQVEG